MTFLDIVAGQLAAIGLHGFREKVYREGLLQKRVAFVFLVSQNAVDGRHAPLALPRRRRDRGSFQYFLDSEGRFPFQKKAVYQADDFCFFLIDNWCPIGAFSSMIAGCVSVA